MEREVKERTGKVVYENGNGTVAGSGKADRMEKLLREELLPFMKKIAETQVIENALKDARIAGANDLVDELSKLLVQKLSE